MILPFLGGDFGHPGQSMRRFQRWKRDAGVILLSAAGLSSFIVVSFIFMVMSEEFRTMMGPETVDLFSDYVTGSAVLVGMVVLGMFLLWRGTQSRKS